MDSARQELIEARRLINTLATTCRQVQAYLDGISVMDEVKLKRTLNKAIRQSSAFLKD